MQGRVIDIVTKKETTVQLTAVEEAAAIEKTAAILAEQEASKEKADAKEKAIKDALPTWEAVNKAIEGAATVDELKAIVTKLARVIYWLAKGQGE